MTQQEETNLILKRLLEGFEIMSATITAIDKRLIRVENTMATKEQLAAVEQSIRADMATKEELASHRAATQEQLAAIQSEMATKYDIERIEDKILEMNQTQELIKYKWRQDEFQLHHINKQLEKR